MGQAIPKQHPAVVLRSHYTLVRALLAITTIAVVALTSAVVILAADGDEVTGTSSARPSAPPVSQAVQGPAPGIRYDGGPDEGTRGIARAHSPSTRYDGGPDEGTRGIVSDQTPGTDYNGPH
jgi:hypothetical protein